MADLPDDLYCDRARDLIRRSRAIRRAAGLGMAAMCRRAGCSKSTLSAWERGMVGEIGRHSAGWDKAWRWIAALAVLDDDAATPTPSRHRT